MPEEPQPTPEPTPALRPAPEKTPTVQAVAAVARPESIHRFEGVIIGHISQIDSSERTEKEGYEKPPADVRGFRRLAWLVKKEAKYNPMTVFELYLSCIGMGWGSFLLLPGSAFDGQGKLWVPIRTFFGGGPGSGWYDSGAETMVGLWLVGLHFGHVWGILHRRAGDAMRGLTICVLLSTWFSLGFLFFVADRTVSNWVTLLIACIFLLVAVKQVFAKTGTA